MVRFVAVALQLLEEAADEAGGLRGGGGKDLGARGEGAEGGVGDDVFDDGLLGEVEGDEPGAGQVLRGDLEAVEEESGAARIDLIRGDAAEDFTDGDLDGSPVFGREQVEGGLAAAVKGGVGDGLAGGVVVVAKFFLAKCRAGAAAAVGVDVAAVEALWRGD